MVPRGSRVVFCLGVPGFGGKSGFSEYIYLFIYLYGTFRKVERLESYQRKGEKNIFTLLEDWKNLTDSTICTKSMRKNCGIIIVFTTKTTELL